MPLWGTLSPRMAKPDDRDTKRMDAVLPAEAEQPVVRRFHYTTDHGIHTDPDKELIRGLRRDNASASQRDNLSELLDDVEKDLANSPAPTPSYDKLSGPWTVPALPRNRRGLMLMIYGGVVATAVLAAIVVVAKVFQSAPPAVEATATTSTITVQTFVPPTPSASTSSNAQPAPTMSTPTPYPTPTTSTPKPSAAPTTQQAAPLPTMQPSSTATAGPKPSTTATPPPVHTGTDSLMKPEI